MDLTQNQIPKVYNIPNQGFGKLVAANVVTLGVDTNGVDVYTVSGGVAGSRVNRIMASTDSAADVGVFLWILRTISGTPTAIPVALISVPLSSGNITTVKNANLLDRNSAIGLPLDNGGNPYIDLLPGDKLRAGTKAALAGGVGVYVTVGGLDMAV